MLFELLNLVFPVVIVSILGEIEGAESWGCLGAYVNSLRGLVRRSLEAKGY